MNTKTEEQRDAEAEAFLAMIENSMPSSLRTEHMVRAVAGILTSFCDEFEDAGRTILLSTAYIKAYYDDQVDDCTCPKCTAERNANAH